MLLQQRRLVGEELCEAPGSESERHVETGQSAGNTLPGPQSSARLNLGRPPAAWFRLGPSLWRPLFPQG